MQILLIHLSVHCENVDDLFLLCRIYLKDVVALGVENGTARLHPRKYRVVQADKTYRGEIRVGITFTPEVKIRPSVLFISAL